jgi:hypothetical protein
MLTIGVMAEYTLMLNNKRRFYNLIKQLGFNQTWKSNLNYYILSTDKIGIGFSNN